MTRAPTRTEPAAATYSVPPVVRAIKVLRHIAAGRSVANQSKAAREIGINRTTLLRLLHTLEAEGLIDRLQGSDEYQLGTGVIDLAARKIHSIDATQIGRPLLATLATRIGLACHLGVRDGRDVLYVLRVAPDVRLVSNVKVGTRLPAHASSMGRVILAYTPWDEVEALYRGIELKAVTAKTATSLPVLKRSLAETRTSGIVDSHSAYEIGVDSVAAPVFDHTGRAVAAINASGPSSAFGSTRDRRIEITEAIRATAAAISRQLGWTGVRPSEPLGRIPSAASA